MRKSIREGVHPGVAEVYVNCRCCRSIRAKCVNPTVTDLTQAVGILCLLALLSACGEPVYDNAGSPHSLLDDREACIKELEQSPAAMAYRQNPTTHPDYVSHVFTDMNRCIERKGWKLLSAQPQQAREPASSGFAQAGQPAPRADHNASRMVVRGVEERLAGISNKTH